MRRLITVLVLGSCHSPLCFTWSLCSYHYPSPLLCSLCPPPPNRCLNIDICESPTLFASIYPIKMWFYWSKQVLWTPPLPLPSDWHLPHNYHICSLLFPPPLPLPIPFDMSSPLCTLFFIFKLRLYNPVTTYNIIYIPFTLLKSQWTHLNLESKLSHK